MATKTQEYPQSLNLTEIFAPIVGFLSEVERRLVLQVQEFDPGVRNYVKYVLDSQGKRLRPSLALFASNACGTVIEDESTNLGVIVELVHIATLIHDDINDGALVRHNKPSVNAKWGNELSVLLGDCLFARALRLASAYPTTFVCRRVSDATNIVCSGEILQTQNRFNFNLNIGEYLKCIEMKTAELFAVSCELGAFLAGANDTVRRALREYGLNLGIAYQMYDDCVDILGQERMAGKSLGTDLAKGKLTLPILHVIQNATIVERKQLNDMVLQNGQGNHGQDLLELFTRYRAFEYTVATTEKYLQRALRYLEEIPLSPSREALAALAMFVSQQSHSLST